MTVELTPLLEWQCHTFTWPWSSPCVDRVLGNRIRCQAHGPRSRYPTEIWGESCSPKVTVEHMLYSELWLRCTEHVIHRTLIT